MDKGRYQMFGLGGIQGIRKDSQTRMTMMIFVDLRWLWV